ncbi:MAG: AAA domain-containing protein [Clostridia bacterium]|nr:AAA domain-containing protein [Clostridia bacterium]
MDIDDKVRKQVTRWRDKYLNSSIKHNNLLNMNPERKGKATDTIRLLANEKYNVDSFWNIAADRGGAAEYPFSSASFYVKKGSRIEWEANGSHALECLDKVIDKGSSTIVQRGENPVCLVFGKLTWYVKSTSPTDSDYGEIVTKQLGEQTVDYVKITTPLIFVPVKVTRIGTSYWLNPVPADSNEATVNPVLIKRYAEEGYKNFPLPEEGQSIDFSKDGKEFDSFDLHAYYEQFQKMCDSMPDDLPFELDQEFVGLDAFDYSRICMYRDVLKNEDDIVKNPIIRAMFGEDIKLAGKDAAEIAKIDETPAEELLNRMDQKTSFELLDSDSSQHEVIERFKRGESFVLEGPPGTGKTQTIINMIAEAIMARKRVLFVSGKMSALNTVVKKLQLMPGVNIDKHCLLITGDDETQKNNVSDTYGKLQASYNTAPARINNLNYQDSIRQFNLARQNLDGYNKELWDKNNSLKMSIYDIAGRILALGYQGNYIRLAVPEAQLKVLTREELDTKAEKLDRVQKLLISILSRCGTLQRDVWYGLRKTEFTGSDQSRLNGFVSSMTDALDILTHAYDCLAVLGGDQMQRIITDLKALPISSVQAVADTRLAPDLDALFNGNFRQQIKVIKAEKERSRNYAGAAERYFAVADDLPSVDTKKMRAKLVNAGDFAQWRLSEINGELDRVRVVSDTLDHITGKESGRIDKLSLKELHELVERIDTITENDLKAEKLEKEIGARYDDSIFDYDYSKLLTKLRTKWRKNVERHKAPAGFKGAVKELMKRCSDTSVDFTITYVFDLINKLDTLKKIDNTEKLIRTTLADYGLDGEDLTVHTLTSFNDFLKHFLKEREDFAVQNLLGGAKNGFRRFVQDRLQDLKSIGEAVQAFSISKDITVAEFLTLPDDYDIVSAETKRLDADKAIRAILPSLYNGCRTPWDEVLGILNILADVLTVLGAGKDAKGQRELFNKITGELADAGFGLKAEKVLSIYSKFYGEPVWFAPGDSMTDRRADALTYDACVEWLNEIKDTDHVEEYVAYRNITKEIEGKTEGSFYTDYMKRSRKDFPIDRIGAGYRISVLWAYYEYLTNQGRMVAKLSQGNALEDMIQTYSETDSGMHEYNRRLVDMQLAAGISHNTTLHSYLETQTQDKNYSVRKILKYRHDSIVQLAPCIMMSVYSVSKLLPYGLYDFDAVIFDEASQIPEEDALTSIMRTRKQVVIAGDPKQMPAVSYFQTKSPEVQEDDDSAISCDSIIDFILNAYDNKIRTYSLKTHYRSNHESLIKYSNENPNLYGGKLVTFPSPKAREENFGLWNYCMSDEVPVIAGGEGQNETEATKVLELIRAHFRKWPLPERTDKDIEKYNSEHSLGVIVFGVRQKGMILDMMMKDRELKKVAMYGDNRVFSVTPVDEIQGDEMCEMILSLTYGRNPDGEVSTSWGHMNQLPVALYKFNVAVTRAKDNLKFVHSVKAADIDRSGSRSLAYVADYLRQFEEASSAQFVSDTELNTDFVASIGAICEQLVGKDRVVYSFGASPRSYRVPVSILSEDRTQVILGIMCETDRASQGFALREYTRTCDAIMESHGWNNMYRVYAIRWLKNYRTERDNLILRVRDACAKDTSALKPAAPKAASANPAGAPRKRALRKAAAKKTQ